MRQLQKILPVVYLFMSLLCMGLLHLYLPIISLINTNIRLAGIIVSIAGLTLCLLCVVMFKYSNTPIIPFRKSTTLITHGVYQITRNPVYLGMLVMLLGVAVFLGTLTPFLVVAVFYFIIQEGYIKYEEQFLEKIFGDEYLEYKSDVRRWL